jgi:hypothetical protein
VLAAHEALAAEDFTFALDYAPGMAWGDYLDLLETRPPRSSWPMSTGGWSVGSRCVTG